MPDSDTHQRLIILLKQLGVAALYVLLAKVALEFFSSNGVVSTIWPSSGLALAVLLIGGVRYSWSIFLGAFLANSMTGIAFTTTAAAIATGNTLEAFIAAWLLTRNSRFDKSIHSLRSYLLLILAGSIGSINGALNGATTLLLAGLLTPETYFVNLVQWWMGDMLGIALITPLILVCWQSKNDWHGAGRVAEAVLLLGLAFMVGQIVFLDWGRWFLADIDLMAEGYVMFLVVMWIAMRLGARGTVIAINMVAIQGLLGAHRGIGYFADDIAQAQLANYWLFMMTLSGVGMALATYISWQKRSEEALRRSETKFRTLYDSIGDAVHLMDETGFIDCNKATLAMCGCATKEEFCSKSPIDFSPPEQPCGTNSVALTERYIATAMETGSHRFDWVCKRFDNGKLFNIDVQLTAMKLDGKPVFLVVARDITERKQVEEELRESEERLRSIMDNTSAVIFIKDTAGKYLLVNSQYEKLFHISNAAIQRKTDYDLFPKEMADAFVDADKKVIQAGRSLEVEEQVPQDDGIHAYISVKFPLRNISGEISAVCGIATDITGRKNIENELKLTKERYDFATAVGRVGTWDWNPVTGDLVWSDETFRLMGYTPGSVTPTYELYLGLVHPGDRVKLDMAVQAALRARIPYDLDCRIILSSGENLVCHVTGKVEFDANGQPARMLGTIQDITGRKIAEQQLHELAMHIQDVREEEKTRIAREIHDELGGTLAAIKIDTHWLLRKLPVRDETMALIERIQSISKRVDNAVIATRQVINNMRPSILDDLGLLAAIEWQAAEFSGHSGIECHVSCIEDEANLDKQHSTALFRILQEALTNISRHSGASRVEIEFQHGSDKVILRICDNGCGIQNSPMAATRPHDFKSYGLLGMIERAEQLGGKILFGNRPGYGFCIDVILPLPAVERSI